MQEEDNCENCNAREANGSFDLGGVETRLCGSCSGDRLVNPFMPDADAPVVIAADFHGNWHV
ncbi:hypothetical protein ACIOHE_26450 [Streptomyces sp. NPDC087851]|uniref:hypothetical protein n=1 Tax=Streptomyces sp. NPDC087851 TaxID=3365810 RepID=UPI0038299105